MAVDDAALCAIQHSVFTTAYRNDLNKDLNDYGRIHVDAEDPACAENASFALSAKVRNQLAWGPTTFQQWLDGYNVALIFGAAQRLGALGYANPGLDEQLRELEGRFKHFAGTPPSGGCGGNELNTCMDDLAGSAAGYAWMAAYKARRRHRNTTADIAAKRELARQFIADALTPVTGPTDRSHGICLRKTETGPATPLCNAGLTELRLGTAVTVSANGNQQLIPYGLGLMTTIGSAILGIDVAESSWTPGSDQTKIARLLFEEAQRHINTSSQFTKDCVKKSGDVLVAGTAQDEVPCGGGGDPYQPNMYRLKPLYDDYFDGPPLVGTYRSSYFDTRLFRLGSFDNGHFSFGR